MTSHFIEYMRKRHQRLASAPKEGLETAQFDEVDCLFCMIIRNVSPAFKVYEDDFVLAFLDILPISRGHTLLVPKRHAARMTSLDEESAAALGATLPPLCRSICKAMDNPDFNIVNNNGYAQVVDHVHLHLVPAPTREAPRRPPQMFGDNRTELDDEEGEEIANMIKAAIAQEKSFSQRNTSKI